MGIDNHIKFLIIALFFLNAFYAKGGLARGKRDQVLLIIAMGATLLADSFMLLFDMRIVGLLAFCVVQAVHNYRFTNKGRVISQVVFGVITFLIAFLSGTELLFALGAAYAVFLLFSVTGAFMAYSKYPAPNNMAIVVGMILFLGCDIFVGIYNLPIEMDYQTRELVFRGIWLCYFPSQAFLSSSARKMRNYKEEDEKRKEAES